MLAGVHDIFPMHLWCRLLFPAETQLNLLRMSHTAPKISVFAHVNSPHNFMLKPLAPLGYPVQVHEKPGKRGTWAEHSVDAWNLGTLLEHHRYFIVYSKFTRSTRIANTVYFQHKYLTSPSITPEDAVVATAPQLTEMQLTSHATSKN